MSYFSFIFFAALMFSLGAGADLSSAQSISKNTVNDGEPVNTTQLFSIMAGSFSPKSVRVTNGDYAFNYQIDTSSSYMADVGWSTRMFRMLGRWDLAENLNIASFSGATGGPGASSTLGSDTLRLHVIALDLRLMYAMDWFPWKILTPFVDGGYQVGFYNQTGKSDLESVQGTTGNWVAGAGIRILLNASKFKSDDLVQRYSSLPLFITAKMNWILPNNQDLDLASSTFLLGMTLGL